MVDMVGKRYGRLIVLEYAGLNKWAKPRYTWLCRCDCGNEVTVAGMALRSGNTKSCGCLQRERQIEAGRIAKGRAGFNRLYREYVRSARRKGYPFELTKEDFSFITKMNCHYCGVVARTVRIGDTSRPGRHGDYIYNGIDRIDSAGPYALDNVAPCCKTCNYMKRSMGTPEFLAHIERIHEHQEVRRGKI